MDGNTQSKRNLYDGRPLVIDGYNSERAMYMAHTGDGEIYYIDADRYSESASSGYRAFAEQKGLENIETEDPEVRDELQAMGFDPDNGWTTDLDGVTHESDFPAGRRGDI